MRTISDFYYFIIKEMPKGEGLENIWMSKSKISSKGVGITIHD